MDKKAIKNFATWARTELIDRVKLRAEKFGVFDDRPAPSLDSYNGYVFTNVEKEQRQTLVKKIARDGYEQTMEEVAYTWFNRFCALRFMEVNEYLPSRVRVFTNEANEFKPQIIDEVQIVDLEGLDLGTVFAFQDKNDDEGLFKYLIITQCNALNAVLPGMFQKINDYTELLFPDNLRREESVVGRMIEMIPLEDWQDQVQIIGWLYQYYITELNELVYDGNLSKSKITKNLLPAATTIYTPDWPVRYMVENSLGRLWLEGHPNEALKSEWKYYLDDAEQDANVQSQLETIRKEYAALKPEEIRVIDPCMGSGHILCVLFDILIRIYEVSGYTTREAVIKIIENNLWGLDLDDRAAQLSYFAVMMKARRYDRRFFTRNVQPSVFSINESNGIDEEQIELIASKCEPSERKEVVRQFSELIECFQDAKEYGSIIAVPQLNWKLLRETLDKCDYENSSQLILDILGIREVRSRLIELLRVGEALSQKYHVVVTNPPYLGSSRLSPKLNSFVKKHFLDVKSDMCMVVYKYALEYLCHKNGFVSFITTTSWMFLSSFEKLRKYVINNCDIISLVDYGTELFDGKVGHNPIVSWIVRNSNVRSRMIAVKLTDYCYSRRDEKEQEFFNIANRHYPDTNAFLKIPSSPIAYWVSDKVIQIFANNPSLNDVGLTRLGMTTGENAKFVRFWYEVARRYCVFDAISQQDLDKRQGYWVPYNKGGAYRKWYGNNDYVLYWKDNGKAIRNFSDETGRIRSTVPNTEYYFLPCASWSKISIGKISFRFKQHCIFDVAGACYFTEKYSLEYMLGFLNSCVVDSISSALSPTLNYEGGQIASLPVIYKKEMATFIEKLVNDSITLSTNDWNSFETSWDYSFHPLLKKGEKSINNAYLQWRNECSDRFSQLKTNEESLNKIFIDIYGLQDELTPEVDDKDVTVRKADKEREVKSLISYAVGCMFGRYSLDKPGLIYAGGEWDASQYKKFAADSNNVIPITEESHFKDDAASRFFDFIRTVYGAETLEENLKFIADALGGSGSPRDVIRNYFLNGFYADHVKIYQKRPIYWLFDSGKKNGFKCLIYMHRYAPDLLARIRTDYILRLQQIYHREISELDAQFEAASNPKTLRDLNKKRKTLLDQAEEVRKYEEKIHHKADQKIAIDLDDGVKVNYAKFSDVLAAIK